MNLPKVMRCLSLSGFAMAVVLVAGCGNDGPAPAESADQPSEPAASSVASVDHGGWWCTEHGVPEEVCARCDTKLAADFQKKGDWCEEHGRPESQCFICHPELEEKFAAQFEAKFGQKPPKPEE